MKTKIVNVFSVIGIIFLIGWVVFVVSLPDFYRPANLKSEIKSAWKTDFVSAFKSETVNSWVGIWLKSQINIVHVEI